MEPFFQVGFGCFRLLVPQSAAMPLGFFLVLALCILRALAGGNADVGYLDTVLSFAHSWILAKMPKQKHFVDHGFSPSFSTVLANASANGVGVGCS